MPCLKPGQCFSHTAKYNLVEDAACFIYKKQHPTSWVSLLFFSSPLLFLVHKSWWLKSISTDFCCLSFFDLFYHQCRLETEVLKSQKKQSSFTHVTSNIVKLFPRGKWWCVTYISQVTCAVPKIPILDFLKNSSLSDNNPASPMYHNQHKPHVRPISLDIAVFFPHTQPTLTF